MPFAGYTFQPAFAAVIERMPEPMLALTVCSPART
jgi:hypothetical protein